MSRFWGGKTHLQFMFCLSRSSGSNIFPSNNNLLKTESVILQLTLQEGASGMDIKKGGAFNARPYKNPFKGPFGPIFFA